MFILNKIKSVQVGLLLIIVTITNVLTYIEDAAPLLRHFLTW